MATVPPLRKPTVPGVKVKKPKLPKTTKIDTVTGKGAPGGFSGASTKNPAEESARLKGDISKLQSQKSGLQGQAQGQVSGAQGQVSGAQGQAQSQLQSKASSLEEQRSIKKNIASKQTELKISNRAPNFSKGTVVTG